MGYVQIMVAKKTCCILYYTMIHDVSTISNSNICIMTNMLVLISTNFIEVVCIINFAAILYRL